MKANLNKFIMLLVVLMSVTTLNGCKKNIGPQIGIIKFVSTPALNEAYDGIIEGLKKAGYVDGKNITIKNYYPENNNLTLVSMVEDAVNKCDMIFAIATPVAVQVVSELENQNKDIPVFFTAVTDAVESNIISNNEKPGGNISGTSDLNPIKEQLALLVEALPSGAKNIGILSTNEANSLIQIEIIEKEAAQMGLKVTKKIVPSAADLRTATEALILSDKVDAIYLPTDNTVAENMASIAELANSSKVITICGEEGMVSDGGLLTYSINYFILGEMTAEMATKVLNNEAKVGDLPVQWMNKKDLKLVINKTKLDEFKITIPQTLIDRANTIL